jgi:hypothetical protein
VGKPSPAIHPGEASSGAQSIQVDSYGPVMAAVGVQFLIQAREVMPLEGLSTTFAPDASPYLTTQPTMDLTGTCLQGQDSVRRTRRRSGVCRQVTLTFDLHLTVPR